MVKQKSVIVAYLYCFTTNIFSWAFVLFSVRTSVSYKHCACLFHSPFLYWYPWNQRRRDSATRTCDDTVFKCFNVRVLAAVWQSGEYVDTVFTSTLKRRSKWNKNDIINCFENSLIRKHCEILKDILEKFSINSLCF